MSTIDVVIPVHNGEKVIGRTVDALLSLPLPAGWGLRLTVVDDGSSDRTSELLAACTDERLQVATLPRCGGRANARNRGVAESSGEVLVFLDADCRPIAEDFFVSLITCVQAGAELVYGHITGRGEGFWPRYLQGVESRRAQAAATGDHVLAMATNNLAITRTLFEKVGGFGSEYLHYGFEDRDLIARLLAEGPEVAVEPNFSVVHEAGNTVRSYCAKMRDAAHWTAPLFATRHPEIYQRMSYARIDTALAGPLRRKLLQLAGLSLSRPAVWLADLLVDQPAVPWAAQAFSLRVAAALSFLLGCSERRQD